MVSRICEVKPNSQVLGWRVELAQGPWDVPRIQLAYVYSKPTTYNTVSYILWGTQSNNQSDSV